MSSVLNGRSLKKEDLNDLPFLKGGLRETFRVTPTAPGTTRFLSETAVLGVRVTAMIYFYKKFNFVLPK